MIPTSWIQTFESVTVLFVELANIDDITDTNAMQAVGCVNSAFTCFDNVIDNFNVYKVPDSSELTVYFNWPILNPVL